MPKQAIRPLPERIGQMDGGAMAIPDGRKWLSACDMTPDGGGMVCTGVAAATWTALRLFGDFQCVIDFYAEASNGTFEFVVPEQRLHGPPLFQVSRLGLAYISDSLVVGRSLIPHFRMQRGP